MSITNILEKEIILNTTTWQFNHAVSSIFDEHVRRSVPLYDELHSMVLELSENYVKENSIVCDLGTGTGELLSNFYTKYNRYNINLVGIDTSEAMLQKARQKCKGMSRIVFIEADLAAYKLPRCEFASAIYTMQFIDKSLRARVFRNVYNALEAGGAFVIAEKTLCVNSGMDISFLKALENLKRKNGISDEEIDAKRESLRTAMFPITLNDNLLHLRQAGFNTIEQFFQWFNFTGLIAVKD